MRTKSPSSLDPASRSALLVGEHTKSAWIEVAMEDRRQQILDAGLAILREEGLPGFTQPRIAARSGLRQSHLTYYFPTRTTLLAAVARQAIDIQLIAAENMIGKISSPRSAAATIASVVIRHENTRVLVALNQAAD